MQFTFVGQFLPEDGSFYKYPWRASVVYTGLITARLMPDENSQTEKLGDLVQVALSTAGLLLPTNTVTPSHTATTTFAWGNQSFPTSDLNSGASRWIALGETIRVSFIYRSTAENAGGNKVGGWSEFHVGIKAPPPPPPISLTVAAPGFDNNDSPTIFGKYLPGVVLNVPFQISANDSGKVVKSLRASIDGKAVMVTPSGVGKWKLTRNVGTLGFGPRTILITAHDAGGKKVGETFRGTLDVTGKPDFQLKVAAAGGIPLAANGVRFLTKIDVPVTYTGTLDGVPKFYKKSNPLTFTYQDKIQSVTFAETDGDSYSFTFKTNAKYLAGTTVATVRIGIKSTDQLGDPEKETILAVAVPAWMAGGTRKFEGGSYRLDGVKLAKLIKSFPAPTTGINWLDAKLGASTVEATPILDLVAPLALKEKVTFKTGKLVMKAVLFGSYTVWNETYSADKLDIGGGLDSRTLKANKLYIRLKTQHLGSRKFFDHGVKVDLLPKLPAFLVDAKLGLALKLVGDLDGSAGVQFSTVGGKVVLDSAQTYIGLTATVTATLPATLNASVLSGFVGELEGAFALTGILKMLGKIHFGSAAKSTMKATLSGSYKYTVVGTLAKPIAGGIRVIDEHDKVVNLGEKLLFKA
jgi:hypothetical protein